MHGAGPALGTAATSVPARTAGRVGLPLLTPLDPGPDPPLALVPRSATCVAWTWHDASRSGRPRSLLVEATSALATELASLTEALDEPGTDLEILLQRLSYHCALAVNSYLGFSIILVIDDEPITFTLFDESVDHLDIATSATLPLDVLGNFGTGSAIAFYAANPGAFIDLSADLSFALGLPPGVIQLDNDMTSPTRPAARGTGDLALRNLAIGVLLDRGHLPEQANAELRRQARQQNVSVATAAQRVIASAVNGPAPRSSGHPAATPEGR
jgi:hypothetical protein